jgi:hypothetical protein
MCYGTFTHVIPVAMFPKSATLNSAYVFKILFGFYGLGNEVFCSSIIHVPSRKCGCSGKGSSPIAHIFISISGRESDNSIKQFNMPRSGVDRL